MYKTRNEHKKIKLINFEIERVYCNYCRKELNLLSNNKKNNEQVCENCNFILKNSEYLVFNSWPDLNTSDIEAVKLLELSLNSILPILENKNLFDFSSENQQGIIIKNNKVVGLCLDNFKLEKYPDEINYFKNLRYLSLVNTGIRKLPESIKELTNLKALNIKNNNIEFLPDVITTLKRLKMLNLHNNQLRLLPDNIGNLLQLSYLDLENNLLYCVPKSFSQLKNLKVLNIFDNQIKLDLIVELIPENVHNCAIGGNSVSKKSLKTLKNIIGDKSCILHLKRQSWTKQSGKIMQELNKIKVN